MTDLLITAAGVFAVLVLLHWLHRWFPPPRDALTVEQARRARSAMARIGGR